MNVNEKGAIGLIKVIDDLVSKGYQCFTPFSDFSPVDLIAMDSAGNLKRLQIKYRSLDEKRKHYEVPARSVVNGKSVPIDRSLIDGWAIYLADENIVVYLSIDLMEGKGAHYIRQGTSEKYGTVP